MQYFAANKKGNVLFLLFSHASAQLFQMFVWAWTVLIHLCDLFGLLILIQNQLRMSACGN